MPLAPSSDLEKPVDPSTTLSVAEATRRLGVGRARVYQLIEAGMLDTVGAQPVRITLDSLDRRQNMARTVGAPLASLSAWAVLALGGGDAAFLMHVAGLLSDPDRSRARSRLRQQSLLELLARLRNRATERRFLVGAEPLEWCNRYFGLRTRSSTATACAPAAATAGGSRSKPTSLAFERPRAMASNA
jgi:hypothetical protein